MPMSDVMRFTCDFSDFEKKFNRAKKTGDLNDNDFGSLLVWACSTGQYLIAEKLVNAGAALNTVNDEGNTGLHFACSKGLSDLVRLLIQKGADIHIKNKNGETPLHRCCYGSHGNRTLIITTLISAGSQLSIVDKSGVSPLTVACMNGRRAAVRLLLASSPGSTRLISNRSPDKRTPLHWACRHGWVDVAGILLNLGADVDVKDKNGCKPFVLACYHGHVAVAAEFATRSHGIDPEDKDMGLYMLHRCYGDDLILESVMTGNDNHNDNDNDNENSERPDRATLWDFFTATTELDTALLHLLYVRELSEAMELLVSRTRIDPSSPDQ
eukprot:gene8100-16619_t